MSAPTALVNAPHRFIDLDHCNIVVEVESGTVSNTALDIIGYALYTHSLAFDSAIANLPKYNEVEATNPTFANTNFGLRLASGQTTFVLRATLHRKVLASSVQCELRHLMDAIKQDSAVQAITVH